MRIGIDLGGTKIEALALDSQGQERARRRIDTPAGDYKMTLGAIVDLVRTIEADTGAPSTLGIGIPGTLSPDTGRIKNANSTCLIGQALDRDLEDLLDRPIRFANDANCFTLSEAIDGAGAGAASVFGVILGTGVGGGIVIEGRCLAGPNAIAGEWGHNPLPWPEERDLPALPCYCGKQGCIETYLSGPGLCRHYQHLGGPPGLTVPELLARESAGDAPAQQTLQDYCERLAKGLASVINILDPEVIVLGGGLANIDRLYAEIPRRWGRYVFSDRVNTRLEKARHGDSSGVRGAAWLWPNE